MTTTASKTSQRSPKLADFPSVPSAAAAAAANITTPAATTTPTTTSKPHRVVRKGSVGKQPLVPPNEARHYDLQRSASRSPRETESEKWNLNLDAASTARDGRQFAVSKVGNHGRIYLRYGRTLFPSAHRLPARFLFGSPPNRLECASFRGPRTQRHSASCRRNLALVN